MILIARFAWQPCYNALSCTDSLQGYQCQCPPDNSTSGQPESIRLGLFEGLKSSAFPCAFAGDRCQGRIAPLVMEGDELLFEGELREVPVRLSVLPTKPFNATVLSPCVPDHESGQTHDSVYGVCVVWRAYCAAAWR